MTDEFADMQGLFPVHVVRTANATRLPAAVSTIPRDWTPTITSGAIETLTEYGSKTAFRGSDAVAGISRKGRLKVRLYNSDVSGNCYKVRLMLSLLGRDYETVPVDVVDRSKRKQLLGDKAPIRRGPVLELDDGTHLAESNAILCHLARGTEYFPTDPLEQTRV